MDRIIGLINKKEFIRLCRILTVSEMIFIFIMSGMTGDKSHGISNYFAEFAGMRETHIVTEEGEAVGIDASSQEIVAGLSARKLAHIAMYGVLGGLVFFSIASVQKYYLRSAYSMIVCYLYAASDEIHQFFVPGRTSQVRDVFIDSIGFVITNLLLWLLLSRIKERG